MRSSRHRPPPILDVAWLKKQFQDLRNDHILILKKIGDMQTLVSPELEQQVIKVANLSKKIDDQVPDKNVPPNKQKTKGK